MTIGFDLSNKSDNILVGYTKWILKWFAIVCVVIVVVIGGWIGYDKYQNQIVPMIAIECEGEKAFRYPMAGRIKNVSRLWIYCDGDANAIRYDSIQRQLRPAQAALAIKGNFSE